ncbi:kinesin light chain 3 [Hordeum vulgare]|nr:kinesin light chain 3 [Hordeum vulgare]
MYSRRRLLSLLQNARLAPAGRLAAAPPSRSFSLPRAADGAASTAGSSDGHFSCKGSTYAAILIGQAAVVLGLSSNSVLAQDDSTAPAVTSEEADVNVTGLRRIEDGSVISNEHTIKWRMCTDKAREFFLQASISLSLPSSEPPFGINPFSEEKNLSTTL